MAVELVTASPKVRLLEARAALLSLRHIILVLIIAHLLSARHLAQYGRADGNGPEAALFRQLLRQTAATAGAFVVAGWSDSRISSCLFF